MRTGRPIKDITGKRFGSRLVLSYEGNQYWKCICDCGDIKKVKGDRLKRGKSNKCDKCTKAIKSELANSKIDSMIGKVFGSWTVLEKAPHFNLRHDKWVCRCKCGDIYNIFGYSLKAGTSTKCRKCVSEKPGSAMKRLYGVYERNAKSRGHEWSLTMEQFKELTQSNCYYTGLPPSSVCRSKSREVYIYNGIDRLDNTKGYTIENSVPCKGRINEMKMESTYDDFIDMCYLIIKEHERKRDNKQQNNLKVV